jgi:hypothetical protein
LEDNEKNELDANRPTGYPPTGNGSTQLAFSKLWLLWTILFSLLISFPIMLTEQLSVLDSPFQDRVFAKTYNYGSEIRRWLRCYILDLENIFTKICFFTILFIFTFYTSIAIGLPIFMLKKWRKIVKERSAKNGKAWEKFQHRQQQLIISLLLQVSNME